jgi:SAM-dependent methyltransferase
MLFTYGMKLGMQSLLRGEGTREALKNIIVPVNYWRTVEYRFVLESLQPHKHDRILDIGSPKLLSVYLADKLQSEVFTTDIEPYFLADYEIFRKVRNIPQDRYHAAAMDGRHLQYGDNYFTKVYSISVLEHIPDHGDTECVREIARVLKPDGLCSITVPFSPTSRVEDKASDSFYWSGSSTNQADGRTFFQRRYSEEDLRSRLIQPSGLRLKELLFVGERIALPNLSEVGRLLHPILGPIHPAFSLLLHSQRTSDWKNLKHPLAALILLVKE